MRAGIGTEAVRQRTHRVSVPMPMPMPMPMPLDVRVGNGKWEVGSIAPRAYAIAGCSARTLTCRARRTTNP